MKPKHTAVLFTQAIYTFGILIGHYLKWPIVCTIGFAAVWWLFVKLRWLWKDLE